MRFTSTRLSRTVSLHRFLSDSPTFLRKEVCQECSPRQASGPQVPSTFPFIRFLKFHSGSLQNLEQISNMFCEVELLRDVAVLAENLEGTRLVPQRFIITRLLEDLLNEKASKDHGYFLAITSLKSIGKGEVVDETGGVFFPVVFNCRIFLPFKGEILEGVVHRVFRHGVFLRCGPIRYAFLSARKMPNYQYVDGENPAFLSDELVKIENDIVVRFMVLGVRWIEKRGDIKKEFVMLTTLEGDSLGPISSSGSGELYL